MGNQVTLAVPDVKSSLVVEVLAAHNGRDFKIGLMIPTDLPAFVLPFPMLLFVQNAKQLISKGKAQIGKTVIELPVIKGRMLGEADGKCDTVWLFLGKCFCFLLLGNDSFQMVVSRIFTELFFKVGTAHFLAEQGKFHIPQGYGVLVEVGNLVFVRTDIHHIALMVEIAERVKLRKLLRKTPRIATAVNACSLPLYQFKEIKELLHGGRLGENLLHLFSGHVGKVGTPYLFKQGFFVAVQVTDKVGEPQGESIPFVSRGQVTVCVYKTLPCHFPLGVDFILRGRDALQKIGIAVFLFRIKITVILDKLPQAFFCLRPT